MKFRHTQPLYSCLKEGFSSGSASHKSAHTVIVALEPTTKSLTLSAKGFRFKIPTALLGVNAL